jgi:hypothetical protein
MILDNTTRKLQVVLGEAHTTNALPVVTAWFDSGIVPSGGPQLTNTNGVTAVDIVAAPASGYIRQVNELTVFNADTVSHTVSVRYNDNGTTYIIQKVTLAPGETLNYSKALSWSKNPGFTTGQIPGTTTNDNAAAGMIGEYIANTGALVNSTGTSKFFDICNIQLTAGDWELNSISYMDVNGGTWTRASGGIGTVVGDSGVGLTTADNFTDNIFASTSTVPSVVTLIIPGWRASIATTTTYYLKGFAVFSAGTPRAYGRISARRKR